MFGTQATELQQQQEQQQKATRTTRIRSEEQQQIIRYPIWRLLLELDQRIPGKSMICYKYVYVYVLQNYV